MLKPIVRVEETFGVSKGVDRISWRIQAPVYGAGMFASTVTDVISIILPIWLAGTGESAATIGLIIGSKHILPILLAIHGGALMDRFGAVTLASLADDLQRRVHARCHHDAAHLPSE